MLISKREFSVSGFETTWKAGELWKKRKWYLCKGSSYSDLKNRTTIVKTDQEKLNQFAEQMKFAFATKIELKHKDIERKIGIFLILNIQNYSLPKIVNDHEKFISLNGSNIKLSNFFTFSSTCASILTFILQIAKLQKWLFFINLLNQKV